MSNIKNKVPLLAPTSSNMKKKDVTKGNTEIQIKEEPADMEEYLKSSGTVIKADAKMQVPATSSSTGFSSSSQVRLSTPGKTALARVLSPAAAAAATTPKPTAGVMTRSQAQNLTSLAASKTASNLNAAKLPIAGAKDIGADLTAKQKAIAPASAANGKPAGGNPKNTTLSTTVKASQPPRSILSVASAKSIVAISVSAGTVSADPKAVPALEQDGLAVKNPRKAPFTIVGQKGDVSQIKSGPATLLMNSKVVSSSSAIQKSAPLSGNPRTPVSAAGSPALQKQAKYAKAVACTPTSVINSRTTGKKVETEAVPDVMCSSEFTVQNEPVSCQQTSLGAVAEIDVIAAPCPDTISWHGQSTDEYAGRYESGTSDIQGVLAQPDEAALVNSSVSDNNCAEDLEITIKIESPDDYSDNTAIAPEHVAVKDISHNSSDQRGKQTVSTSDQAAQIQIVYAGNREVTTRGLDTLIVSSGIASTAASAGQSAAAVMKVGYSMLAGSETSSRSSGISKPLPMLKVGSAVCSESTTDSSVLFNRNKSSSSAATQVSSAGAGIVSLPENDVDLSIVKTEPMDSVVTEEPVSSDSLPAAVDETSNAEPSADNLQTMDTTSIELHAVPGSSVSGEDAEEQMSAGEHPELTTTLTQVAACFAAMQPNLSVPDHSMPQVDSRTSGDQNQNSLEIACVESSVEEMLVSNQMRDGTSKQDSGPGKTVITHRAMVALDNSHVDPNFVKGLTGNAENMTIELDATVISSSGNGHNDGSLTADHGDASLLFSDVSNRAPSGNLSKKNQVSDLPTLRVKPAKMPLKELSCFEDIVCGSGQEANLMECDEVSAEGAHQTSLKTPLPARKNNDKQLEQLEHDSTPVTNSTTASGTTQSKEEIVKRVVRLTKPDKSKRQVEDKSVNEPVAPPTKRTRLMAPISEKENSGMTGMESKSVRKKPSSHRVPRKKILTPCTSQHPSVERKHLKKNPIGKVSDDLWMETSSFLDEDLRSEPESNEPDYIFEPRNHKPRTDLRAAEKGKQYGNSKSSKSFMNQTNRGKILRKEPNVFYRSTRHTRFPFLSQFVERSADRCHWDWASCHVEDISASQRQDLLSDLNSVYLGRQPRFLLKPMQHLDGLSLETQLESQLLDFHSVRIIFLEVARDWVRKKPLHLLMSGQLKIAPRTYMPPKRMSKTNTTFEHCQKAFSRDICYILADICNLGESDDSLFALPDGVSQFTANRVFRKVRQYLRNYVERLLRTVVNRSSTNFTRLFNEDNRRIFSAKVKSKRSQKESSLVQLPVCEKVLQLQEANSVLSENDGAGIKDPALDDSAVHETVSHGPSKRLSAELSLPVQNSLDAAYDLFSKEAENICQVTLEAHVVADVSVVNDSACTVIDSSKLYSPTRPTDFEELEIGVLENVEASEVVTAEAISKETGLCGDANNVIPGRVLGRAVSNDTNFLVKKALSPKNAHMEEAEDGEIENTVDQPVSVSSSVIEDTFHGKKLRSLVARRTEKTERVPSVKRKKRTKTSKEKKTKKKKEKRKSESHLSSEKDRGHKRKRFKYSEEDRVESKRHVASPENLEVSRAEPVKTCLASTSDSVYFDSYTTVVEDVLSSVPLLNFEDNFDPLLPSSLHYRNPYRFSWPLIDYFVNRNVGMLSKLILSGIIPDANAFRTRLLKPGNSFLWSLILTVFDVTSQTQTEVKTASETDETLKSVIDDQMELGCTGEDGVKKLSVKGNNPLMQAFRQVVEAKRRLSREAQKSKPISSITKLSAELAALRAAPKSAKPLYKPTSNTEPQHAFQISDPNSSRLLRTVERSVQLASDALFQLSDELRMLLNEQEDTAPTECLTITSDLPRIEMPIAGSHLGELSALAVSLYENYERLSKVSEDAVFSRPASELDECITIIDDDNDIILDDKLDDASSDVNIDLRATGANQCVGDAADLEQINAVPEKNGQIVFDLSDEEVTVSVCPELSLPKDAERAVGSTVPLAAEKEAAKVKDMEEVGLLTLPALPAPNDRQYISSFPPINVKKKSKTISQVPRMVFSKLIGPSLERLGSASSLLEKPQPTVSAQQLSSVSATSAVVISSPLSLIPDVSVDLGQEQDGEMNQSSAASTIIGKNDSLPSCASSSSGVESSQNKAPANVKALAKSKTTLSTEQQKILPNVSNATGIAQDFVIIAAAALSSAVSTSSPSHSAAAAVTVVAPISAADSQAKELNEVPSASIDEMSYSATFPPIPPEKPSSENSLVLPPLPLGEADMLPPPLPPMTLSEMATSGSNSLVPNSSSAYYSGYYSGLAASSQSQEYSTAFSGYHTYAGGSVDPTQSLVSPWMYDQNMYPTSNQTPILDPSLMAYPPPQQVDPMSFYLQPTNQPPPFLPASPASQLFPAYPSSQSIVPAPAASLPYSQATGQLPATFPFPPPNLPPPTVPHPTIPPPTIPPPSIPPPSVFPSAAPFPTSLPPPAVLPYSMYNSQWTPDVSSHSNPFYSTDYYSQTPSSTSLATMPSGSASVSVPPPALEGQQGSQLPNSLSSIHDMVKFPPPVVPGASMPNSNIPDSQAQNPKPAIQTDSSLEKDQSVQQFSSKSSDAFEYAAPSYKKKSQDTYPAVSSADENRFSGLEQLQEMNEMNDHDTYVKSANQKSSTALDSAELEKGFCSENQSWDSLNLPHDSVSDSWESMNSRFEDSWSGQSTVEQGPPGRQQRTTVPLLQKPKDVLMNIQPRKPPLQDQGQMHDSLQRLSDHKELPPGSRTKQLGASLDQRMAVPRHLRPGPEPRQPGPLLRQPGPSLRQPVPESRHPGPVLQQPSPEPRQPGPLLRQPGPLSRQPGPPLRQPGPQLRQSVPEQKQSGQSVRQPGATGQKQEGSQRKQGMQPRPSHPDGQEQKLLGSQSRPSNPQQRLNGPDQGHSGSLQGPRGQERRLLGPQAVGLQAGPKSVAPLMAVPIRRPLEGAVNQSGKHERPGHVAPQGPLSNTRFFVFNTDRAACETAEHLLLCSGAKKFDPYNINALRMMPEIRCLLLVHKEDLKHVQRIPSLLRLKRDLRVSFVTFGDASDIQHKRLVAFFPRAGTMIMDLTALLACKSDVLDGMCQFMTQQTVEKRTSWKLMLPSNVFNAIDFLKYKYEDEPEEHVRLAEVSQILATYKTSGIVEFLPENPYRGQPRTTVEYQASCVALQVSRLGSFRHFLFVTDMPRNHPDANLFLNNGIDILSIPEFMRCFVSRQVDHQPKLHPPYITRVTNNRYHDAAISNGTECIGI